MGMVSIQGKINSNNEALGEQAPTQKATQDTQDVTGPLTESNPAAYRSVTHWNPRSPRARLP